MPKNLAGGVRMNAAFTYLAPARQRPNLELAADALVDRVLVEDHRAAGVLLADGRVFRGRETVLCAGAFGSPAVLMRSGIGPADHLRGLGIPVVADRPGVGECLLDHPLVDDVGNALVAAEHAPPEQTFCPTLLKARSRQAAGEIDLHVYHGQHRDEAQGGWVLWFSISLEHATSRGRLRLTAADPEATLEIDHRHLTEPREVEAFCDGVELVSRLVATPPLAGMVAPLPGWAVGWRDRADLRARVRKHAATTFHPSSTCRMGPATDATAVVDRAGRVHGIAGLRVADASIFSTGPRANLHCTVVAVAEKIAAGMREAAAA
jgi:choline dehydrogenase